MKFGVDKNYEVLPLSEINGDILFEGKTKFQCFKWIRINKPKEKLRTLKEKGKFVGQLASMQKEGFTGNLRDDNPNIIGSIDFGEIVPQIEDKEVKERVIITYEDLTGIMIGGSPVKLREAVNPINEIMAEFFIADTFQRSVDFLAQIGHESGSLNYQEEIASGKAYEGRKDLGNTHTGDGVKYKGRGILQLTGYSNYKSFEEFVFSKEKWKNILEVQRQQEFVLGESHPILNKPEIVKMYPWCVVVAGYFWQKNNLIKYSDTNDFMALTRRINGGTTGYQDRVNYRMRATEVLERFKHLKL